MDDIASSVPASDRKEHKSLIRKIFPFINRDKHDSNARETIEDLIENADQNAENSIEEHERALIANVLELRDLPVVEVMVPRADIIAVDIKTTSEELFQLLGEKPHSRVPVYEDDLDNIVGAVHMKDIVGNYKKNRGSFRLRDILRNVLIVSPAMRVMDLLMQMRQSRVHLAMVVDEFGGIDGLIAINDLIEGIVGEIDDEHDLDVQPQAIERPDGTILADARFQLEDFEQRFDRYWNTEEEEENDTLGGLVSFIAGHVPALGETVKHPQSGIEFEILEAAPRRISRMRIRNLKDSLIIARDENSKD